MRQQIGEPLVLRNLLGELAERVGTTQSAIARLEGGNISPSLPTLDKIAHALGAEVSLSFIDLYELTKTGS